MSEALVAFLRVRLGEDEKAARTAAPGPWTYGDVDSVAGGMVYDPTVAIASLHYEQPGKVDPRIRRTVLAEDADGTGRHIARHDPTRVLREVEAKRQILEIHEERQLLDPDGAEETDDHTCGHCFEDFPCPTLRLLALPYADHPDYKEAWRP